MIGVIYRVAGQLVQPVPELVDTPFIVASLRIGRRHLLRGLVLGGLDVQVAVDADDDTHLAVAAVCGPPSAGDTLVAASVRAKVIEARAVEAREHLDRLLDDARG